VNDTWTCHARPAPHGKPCGHVNTVERRFLGLLVCAACGCTKFASDARERELAKERTR
jgi:hypothetical protein